MLPLEPKYIQIAVLSFYGLFSQFLHQFVNNKYGFGDINLFLLLTKITSLMLKKGVVGQEQGAMDWKRL
jgi:hypothetical protein